MHGRVKKDIVEPSPEEKAKQKEHVRTASALFKKLLALRRAETYNAQTMDMTFKALQFHPEFPTLWGYRRELILQVSGGSDAAPTAEGIPATGTAGGAAGGTSSMREVLELELKLLEKALRKSQKVYSIWFHRKWTVERLLEVSEDSEGDAAGRHILDTELGLCNRLLEVDERNFHCWNHRAHVLGLMRRRQARCQKHQLQPKSMTSATDQALRQCGTGGYASGTPPVVMADDASALDSDATVAAQTVAAAQVQEDSAKTSDSAEAASAADVPPPKMLDFVDIDLKLSKDLINRNFSNYSAWHLRALLQQEVCTAAIRGATDLQQQPVDMEKELEWVQQGIYTEPNDQSVWLYHHWLTTLGRGCEGQRITHCAILGGDLFLYFSGPVCVRRCESGSSERPAVANVRIGSGGQRQVSGYLAPVASDPGCGATPIRRLTRGLPQNRRRWSLAWRFVPADCGEVSENLFGNDVTDMDVAVTVEHCGSTADGTAEYSEERLCFKGAPVLCDASPSAEHSSACSAALAGLLAPAPDAERSNLLKSEMARVEELLEIEPDCKWALLAQGRLATAAAAGGAVAQMEAVQRACGEGYRRLAELDPLRRGFYDEARAGSDLRLRALAFVSSIPNSAAALNISNLGLRRLAPAPVLATIGVRRLVVEDNDLQELGPILLLSSLEELCAARNKFVGEATSAFVLPRLRSLDVSSNALVLGGADAALKAPDSLKIVDLSGNPAVLGIAPDGILTRFCQGASAAWEASMDVAASRCVLRRP